MVRYLMPMHYVYSGTNPTEDAKWTRERMEKANVKLNQELAGPAQEPSQPAPQPESTPPTGSQAGQPESSRQRGRVPFRPDAGPNRLQPEVPADRPASRFPAGTYRLTGRLSRLSAGFASLCTVLGLMPRNIPFRCYFAPTTIYTPLYPALRL